MTATPDDNVVRLRPDRRPTAQPWFARLTAVAAAVPVLVVAGLGDVISNLGDRLEASEQATQTAQQDADRFAGLLAAPDVRIATTETVEGVSTRLLYSATRNDAIVQLAGGLETGVTIGITEDPAGGSSQPTTEPILALALD